MARIRRLSFFNRLKMGKMIPFLNTVRKNPFINLVSKSPLMYIHDILPLKYKFLDESYVISDEDNDLGMVTVSPIVGNYSKLIISQLYCSESSYELAQQLINYIVSNYGANGASTFYVTIDQNYADLINIFLSGCGFRQCSSEQIWHVRRKTFKKPKTITYRRFQNSDLNEISEIYNDSLITHFRPTLERTKEEFAEFFCHGLTYLSEYRYVIEDKSSGRIIGYFLISTDDNQNFLLDFNYSDGYEINFDEIMHVATREILKRIRHFKLHIKIKNYLKTGEKQQQYAEERKFVLKQTKLMLVKDFYKQIKQLSPAKEFILLQKGIE